MPVSSDPDMPFVLSPSVLLTQKTCDNQEDIPFLDIRSMYTSQWKYVQILAEKFWIRWRKEYLQTLQPRRKWHQERDNIKAGDVVLLKDDSAHRNYWPLGRVVRCFPGKDGLVRKIELTVFRDNVLHTYVRPIAQVVLLVST